MMTKNKDADLFVSVMDGRNPTEDDYDYKSQMIGADSIVIRSTDAIFTGKNQLHDWQPEVGIIFVVGVLAYSDETDYSLTVLGPYEPARNFTDLPSNSPMIYDIPSKSSRSEANPSVYVYRWYNWAQTDFIL